jgi:hypothetical protein
MKFSDVAHWLATRRRPLMRAAGCSKVNGLQGGTACASRRHFPGFCDRPARGSGRSASSPTERSSRSPSAAATWSAPSAATRPRRARTRGRRARSGGILISGSGGLRSSHGSPAQDPSDQIGSAKFPPVKFAACHDRDRGRTPQRPCNAAAIGSAGGSTSTGCFMTTRIAAEESCGARLHDRRVAFRTHALRRTHKRRTSDHGRPVRGEAGARSPTEAAHASGRSGARVLSHDRQSASGNHDCSSGTG